MSREGGIVFGKAGAVARKGGVMFRKGEEASYDGGAVFDDGGTASHDGGTVSRKGGEVSRKGGAVFDDGGSAFRKGGSAFRKGAQNVRTNSDKFWTNLPAPPVRLPARASRDFSFPWNFKRFASARGESRSWHSSCTPSRPTRRCTPYRVKGGIMTATLIVKSSHPRKGFTAITQLGLKALHLALTHAAAISPRLPQDLVEGLKSDIESFGDVVPGVKKARSESVAATSGQFAALADGHERVRQVRAALRRVKAPADVKRAYGVGRKMRKDSVSDVKAALQQILDRAKEQPAEAESLGIVQKDLDGLVFALAAITDADTKQDQRRASAPLTTQERNRIGNRILAAVARIEGAGRLEFANDDTKRGSFEALGAGPRGRRNVDAASRTTEGVVSG